MEGCPEPTGLRLVHCRLSEHQKLVRSPNHCLLRLSLQTNLTVSFGKLPNRGNMPGGCPVKSWLSLKTTVRVLLTVFSIAPEKWLANGSGILASGSTAGFANYSSANGSFLRAEQ